MKTIIAIDPGASGGIAVLGENVSCMKMPETQGDVLDALRSIKVSSNGDVTCYLEQVGGFVRRRNSESGESSGGQPGSAMFKFGEGFGFLKGCLMALSIRTVMVRPQEWQKRLHLGTKATCASKTEWKNKLKSEAQRRYPQCDVTLKTADALLILDYGVEMEAV